MKKNMLARSYKALAARQLLAAMLSGIVATTCTTTNFAQEADSPPQVATETSVELGKYWLGLGLKKVEGDLATYLGSEAGMFIFEVYPDSPASKAEWKVGDILLSFNGKEISGFETLLTEINAAQSTSAKCILLRKGEKIEEEIVAELRPENVPQIETDKSSAMSWTFEALPQMNLNLSPEKVMVLRAVPGDELNTFEGQGKVFKVERGEFKLPAEALKAIPDLGAALKSLKNIEVIQIGEGMAVSVPTEGEQNAEAVVDGKNITVSVIRKSAEDPGSFTVVIDGEKFEGSMDKMKEAPEKVKQALEKINIGKTFTLENGLNLTISPKMNGDKAQKEIEVLLKKAEEATKKMEKKSITIVTDGKDPMSADVQKNAQVIVTEAGEDKNGDPKFFRHSPARWRIVTEAGEVKIGQIVIASTDDKGEVRVIELDGSKFSAGFSNDDNVMPKGKLPPEALAKIEEAKKKAEASGKKAAAIAIAKAKEADGKMQLRVQATNVDKAEALKKEIEELRATINELKKQIEEIKK